MHETRKAIVYLSSHEQFLDPPVSFSLVYLTCFHTDFYKLYLEIKHLQFTLQQSTAGSTACLLQSYKEWN